ncbi:hypothetical protein GCM10010168_89940 [Actinoplanes ianthinogenes]|uniref:Secreted protein n=1 Tax=Actinoplanes ianthinogenes TaxID=122358 RepID=A0ABN6CKT5_9ACTN|nr:hypothetical protein [Actinoplanes ianthinogenes]BCJ45576.1 hypothetical protein Aiant_62330 [Actinoplanes ianthinogenes]GGR57056.1 hypothetical protein GCM10010168_89940 [Actinoplanes ianthinogenes]
MTGFLIFAVMFAGVLFAIARFGGWVRRKGIGGGIMGSIDEAYRPSADRLRRETVIHEQRISPRETGEGR